MTDNSYIDWYSLTDQHLIKTIGEFIKHHRLNQNKTQQDISKQANISRSTLSLLEKGKTTSLNTMIKVLRVLNLLHCMDSFKVETQISPIQYAKLQKEKRLRASKNNSTSQEDDLGW